MKNIPKPHKLFLDTSVLLSGLNSLTGASGAILALFKSGRVRAIISPEVITEAIGVMEKKFPLLREGMLDFLSHKPHMTKKVTSRELRAATKLLRSEDTPILAGALKSRANFLVTLDKDFVRRAQHLPQIKVISPGEYLPLYRAEYGG